jgi:preprotein translocase SecE subunit
LGSEQNKESLYGDYLHSRFDRYYFLARFNHIFAAKTTQSIFIYVLFSYSLATFLLLRANSKSYSFTGDAVAELTRVHFPGSKEVKIGTVVVIVTVLLAGVFFGFLDLGINAVIKAILGA